MPRQLDKIIRREMEGQQTWQKVAGWVLIILGGGVLIGSTFVLLASLFNWVVFTPLSIGARIFIGVFLLPPMLTFEFWILKRIVEYRRSRKWLAEYERRNPLPYCTDED